MHYGWNQGWVTTKNGTSIDDAAVAGTTGKYIQIEAIEVRLVKVGS